LSEIFPVSSGGSGSSTPLNPYSLQYALNASQQSSLATGYVDAILGTNQTNQPPYWITSFNWSNITLAQALSISGGGTGITESLTPNTIAYAASNTTQSFISPGVFGQVLESTGLSSPPSWTWPSPGTIKILERNFTSNGTFTFPPNVVYTYMVAIGGGGGCGVSAINQWGASSGGGGGGSSYAEFPGPAEGTIQVTIGQGGADLQDGGTTQIGEFLIATGGQSATSVSDAPGGLGYNTEFGIQTNGGAGGAGSYIGGGAPYPGANVTIPVPTGGGGGAAIFQPPNGGQGGSIVFEPNMLMELGGFGAVYPGAAGNGNSANPPAGFVLFAGTGGGGATLDDSNCPTPAALPGRGGAYGGGAGGPSNGNAVNCTAGNPGAPGFVWIMVHYLG